MLVPHRALTNLVFGAAEALEVTAQDVVLAQTTLSFDVSIGDLLLPLCVGSRVVLGTRDTAQNGDELRKLVEDRGVNVLVLTPAGWRLLLAAGYPGGEHVKGVCTGEALPRDLAEALVPRLGALFNGYGPTETTVWSTVYRLPKDVGPILIGKPLGNYTAYVLDERGRQVPVGVPGELYIGR